MDIVKLQEEYKFFISKIEQAKDCIEYVVNRTDLILYDYSLSLNYKNDIKKTIENNLYYLDIMHEHLKKIYELKNEINFTNNT